jgi:hypothetical protein
MKLYHKHIANCFGGDYNWPQIILERKNMIRKQERGSVVEIVIIGVLLLVIAGLVVWRIMDANKPENKDTNTSTTTSKTELPNDAVTEKKVDPNEGYVVINDWGIRFKPVSAEKILYWKSSDGSDTYYFSTESVKKMNGCSDASLYSLTRLKSKDVMTGIYLKDGNKVGDYYYNINHAHQVCTLDSKDDSELLRQNDLVDKLLTTIELKL